MPLAEDDNVIKAIPPDRPDQPLHIPVLPWRPRRNRPFSYPHRPKASDECSAQSAVAVANDIAWRLGPGGRCGNTTCTTALPAGLFDAAADHWRGRGKATGPARSVIAGL
jgi:hypothetical protein